MSNTVSKWPENIPLRTAEEWTALGAAWNSDSDARTAVVEALKALKIPATEYARKQPPERVELVIKLQEQLSPGSTTGAKPAAAKAGAAAGKPAAAGKAAAPKAAGTGVAAGGGGGGSVDLGPVIAKQAEIEAKVDALQATATNIETLLKLVLANPGMADSLALAADPDVLAEFAGKTITEIASGNG